MTEEESLLVHQVTNDYWTEFGKLVAKHIQRVPRHLQDELLMILQDHSSCYGSDFAKYLEQDTPQIEKLKSMLRTE